jgi:3-deoxy-D-manno-octulosonic-acid transferase
MGNNLSHSGAVLAAYRLLASVAYRVPLPPGAFRDSRAGRRGAADRWRAWARNTPGSGPVVWAHAASVGEHQVLEPVIQRLARARPDLRVVLSHTSPSVLTTPVPAVVCHRDYLPWDRTPDIDGTLDAVRPALALFARADLWPAFVAGLVARDAPVAVLGAAVRRRSRRLVAGARAVLRPLHERLAWVGAVTGADADRWRRLGVPAERIAVTGDPRHDRLLERIADPAPASLLRTWAAGGPVLVTGSLEPSDDAAVTQALTPLREMVPELRTVIVPHDPTPERIDGLERRLAGLGLRAARWSATTADLHAADARIAIVTVRGRLADLYLGADVAYVGGGFRPGRLHTVAEPAAVGVPLIIGPRWAGATDADRMVAADGAFPVGSPRELAATAARLLADPAQRDRAGLGARGVLADGAARASADAVLRLLDPMTARNARAKEGDAAPHPDAPRHPPERSPERDPD